MAQDASPSLDLPAGFDTLRQLNEANATGILHLRAGTCTDADVYFMDGVVISVCTLADDWLLSRLMTASGALGREELEQLHADLDNMPLPDALLQRDMLAVETMQRIQGECFHENFVRACVSPWESADFLAEDVVFPANMQLGVDTPALLEQAQSWYQRVQALLAIAARPCDPVFHRTREPLPADDGQSAVASLCRDPITLSEVVARSPFVPFRTELILVRMVAAATLSISVDPGKDREPISVTGDLETVLETLEVGESLSSAAIEPMTASVEALSPVAFEDVDAGGRSGDGEIDYDHVAAGGHAKIYDVLDKVDLSHVDAIPTAGEEFMAPADDEESLVVAGGEEDSLDAPVIGSEDGDSSEMLIEIDSEDYPGESDSSFEAPPIHLSGTEEALELAIEDEDSAPSVVEILTEPQEPADEEISVETGFTPAQVDSFRMRIGVFNQIFRVIFDTFRAALGEEAVLDRFGRFLKDESLQYPRLFRDLSVGKDGTLKAAALIQNLADAEPVDSDSYLHQGLYELIYVHLYDAKDVLTPEQEQSMMDQIAAHEEQLHG